MVVQVSVSAITVEKILFGLLDPFV
jgi:hypothetical protein